MTVDCVAFVPEFIVIVPTRSRPQNVVPVVDAWQETGAFDDGSAALAFVIDDDDSAIDAYYDALAAVGATAHVGTGPIGYLASPVHRPLVPKLNIAANYLRVTRRPYALGFAGDDHRPRTRGWARAYVEALRAGAGVVYGDDGYQHEDLPTEWAMRSDIVAALGGRMVPAPVEHLYCDNSVRDLAAAAGVLRYLPHVSIEHLHPVAGKAASDEQYDRVNSRAQYRTDRPAYRAWHRDGLAADVAAVERVMSGEGES